MTVEHPVPSPHGTPRRLAITIAGIVQGVGFRPFVYRLARHHQLCGWVLNDSGLVRLEIEGRPDGLEAFLDALRNQVPPQARVERIEVREIACQDLSQGVLADFEIRQSVELEPLRPAVPADLGTCGACLEELRDEAAIRYRYPFTNCTNCGPRWSIITRLPYDRPHTTMEGFALCDFCRGQYEDPGDRRFHAQPIACPRCGPHLRLLDPDGQLRAEREEALQGAARGLRAGQIVALKGLGGFQLLVAATDQEATLQLRTRKRRPDKPLAVMLPDAASVRDYCNVTAEELELLASPQAPILLVRRRIPHGERPPLAPAVAPGNPWLGVMLPYTPLHHLLLRETGCPLVCTSGNRSEEPIVTSTAAARDRLADIADLLLTHNRPIVRPVDDSVARWDRGGVQLLRRARGYAPVPVVLASEIACILGVGGHLKNTVALSIGRDVLLSPHVGDLDNRLSWDVHRQAVADLVAFFQVRPQGIACDLHPDYRSTQHARQLARQWEVPLIPIQHHHAHVLAMIAEHGLQGPVLGLAWDGTGYGLDGTVWGGEVLHGQGPTFRRVAHLRSFSLPGGDRAAREPRRAALGLLFEILGSQCAPWVASWFTERELTTLLTALQRPRLFPRCTSMGRLFDAVAALCGLPPTVSFEGQAAMALEFAALEFAEDGGSAESYDLPLRESEPAVLDWEPLVRQLLRDRGVGCPVSRIAARFHGALADGAVAVARRVACPQVVLTGGCFQNALLTELVRGRLLQAGFQVYTHKQVPPGDGGIALGQVLGAALAAGA